MTVTRVWQTGFELNDNALDGGPDVAFTGSMSYSTGTVRTGTYSLAMGTSRYDFYYTLGAAIAQARINCQFYYGGGSGGLGEPELFYFRNSATECIRVKYDIGADKWLIWAGTSSTEIANSLTPLVTGWNRVCVDVKIDATVGWVSLYLDGTEIIDYDGKTDHGAANFNHIGVGPITGTRRWGTSEFVDDITIDNTVGESTPADSTDRRYYLVSASGAGNYTQWTPSAGSNWENVDEITPDGDTTYNEHNVVGEKDSYATENYTPDSGWKVGALIPIAATRKVAGGANDLRVFLRENSTDAFGSTATQTTSYGTFWDRQTTAPDSGEITQTVLNGMETGIDVV